MLLVVAATTGELRGATGLRGVETLACGIGPVESAIAVTHRLARSGARPTAILHVGIAGARSIDATPIGTLVLGDRSVYADTQSTLVPHELTPAGELLAAAQAAFPDAPVLTIGTAADVAGSIHAGLDVEAMEGFGVLRAAELGDVPALEVRVVSNQVDEPDRARWDFAGALDALAAALPRLVTALA